MLPTTSLSFEDARKSSLIRGGLHKAAQHFRDTPRLGDAAARRERWLRIEDFADRADAGFSEMRLKAVEKPSRHRAIIGVNPEPSINEWANQPSPHGSLVIGCIASAQVAKIARFVIGLARRQRAQPDRRHQLCVHRGNNCLPIFSVEDRMLECNRKDLVRSKRSVVSVLAVDDVIEIAASRMPKTAIEGSARLVRMAANSSASGSCASRSQSASMRRALHYQSPLISTALPRRGVTTQSPTFASIQVSAQPSAPWVRSPSCGSTLMPKRVPSR